MFMRKVISIFLLNLMVVIAVHPVVAMHFCGGQLHSQSLYKPDNIHNCCHTSVHDLVLHEFAFAALDAQHEALSCCDFQVVELPTKEYQHQTEEDLTISPQITEISTWLQTAVLPEIHQLQQEAVHYNSFPPEGLFLQDLNRLSYICILRI